MALPVTPPGTTIDYPDTDGLPVAESDFQLRPFLYAVDALRTYFQDRQEVYVAGNLFVYYEEGNPRAVVAPDVFVVIGAARHARPSYKLWEEPKGPDFVLEITSQSTQRADQGEKRRTYAMLGVQEYFQYDPTGDYLVPPLQGFSLVDGRYALLPTTPSADGTIVLHSAVLGLDVRLEDSQLRFYAPTTGQKLLTHQEAEQARQEAEQARRQVERARQEAEERANREAALRQAADARIAELEARLRALQAERPAGQPPPLPPDTHG